LVVWIQSALIQQLGLYLLLAAVSRVKEHDHGKNHEWDNRTDNTCWVCGIRSSFVWNQCSGAHRRQWPLHGSFHLPYHCWNRSWGPAASQDPLTNSVKKAGEADLRTNLRPMLIMVAWSYISLTEDFVSNLNMSISIDGRIFTVTLKKAQRGTAVPCGMESGYLDRPKIVGNAKR